MPAMPSSSRAAPASADPCFTVIRMRGRLADSASRVESAMPLSAEQQESISDYAVPIGVAWKILDQANRDLYAVNLLPAAVKEGQRMFKLAWHGYLLLALLFTSSCKFLASGCGRCVPCLFLGVLNDRRDQVLQSGTRYAEPFSAAVNPQPPLSGR